MSANVTKLSERTAAQSRSGIPRDFTAADRALYDSILDELAATTGATENDRVVVVTLVRCRRAEAEWRDTARQLRKKMRETPDDFADLMRLASAAEGNANKLAAEARASARALSIDTETRSGRAAKKVRAKTITLPPWEPDEE